MHSQSKTWINPSVRDSQQRSRVNIARRKFCPKSAFWTTDFDIKDHIKKWEEGRERVLQAQTDRLKAEAKERERLGLPEPAPMKPAMGGKTYSNNFSSVLSLPTIFTPGFEHRGKEVPGWPSKLEMKYEGDERIATDRIHGRFLPAPRFAGNETVSWMQRTIIDQYQMDDFLFPVPTAVEITLRTHRVEELEFTDEQGREALGSELMALLDPNDNC